MKKCRKCDLSYEDTISFCQKCGEKMGINADDLRKASEQSILEEKVKANPLNEKVLFEYVSLLALHNEHKDVLSNAYKILALNKNNLDAKKMIINALKRLGETKQAYEYALEIHSELPNDIDIAFELAFLSKSLKDNKSIEFLDRIIRLNPPDSERKLAEALLLTESDKYQSASLIWKELFDGGSKNVYVLLFQAISDYYNNNYDKAESSLQQTLQSLEPASYYRLVALVYLMYLYASKKQAELANKLFKEIKTLEHVDALFEEARSVLGLGGYSLATLMLNDGETSKAQEISNWLKGNGHKIAANQVYSFYLLRKARRQHTKQEYKNALSSILEGLELSEKGSEEERLLLEQKIISQKARRKKIIKITLFVLTIIAFFTIWTLLGS